MLVLKGILGAFSFFNGRRKCNFRANSYGLKRVLGFFIQDFPP